jgi:hypothetical protein
MPAAAAGTLVLPVEPPSSLAAFAETACAPPSRSAGAQLTAEMRFARSSSPGRSRERCPSRASLAGDRERGLARRSVLRVLVLTGRPSG